MSTVCEADWSPNPVYPHPWLNVGGDAAVAQAQGSAYPLIQGRGRGNSTSEQTCSLPVQDFHYARGRPLYILGEKADFLSSEQPGLDVLDGGKLHFISVFTVHIQEDPEEHQKTAPDVPEEGTMGRLDYL